MTRISLGVLVALELVLVGVGLVDGWSTTILGQHRVVASMVAVVIIGGPAIGIVATLRRVVGRRSRKSCG